MIANVIAIPAATVLFSGFGSVSQKMVRNNGNNAVTEIAPIGQYSHPAPWPRLSGKNGMGVNPKAIRIPVVTKNRRNIQRIRPFIGADVMREMEFSHRAFGCVFS